MNDFNSHVTDPDGIRDEVCMQSKFQRLVQHPKGTGDLNCPEPVIRAKRLERKRIEKAKIKPLGAKSKRTVILISKRMHKWMQRRHFLSPRRRTLTPSRSTLMRLALFKFMQPQPGQTHARREGETKCGAEKIEEETR